MGQDVGATAVDGIEPIKFRMLDGFVGNKYAANVVATPNSTNLLYICNIYMYLLTFEIYIYIYRKVAW